MCWVPYNSVFEANSRKCFDTYNGHAQSTGRKITGGGAGGWMLEYWSVVNT